MAELQARLLMLKCSLGLYLNQTSPAAIEREMARRRMAGATLPSPGQARPAYWDVTYNFRGVEHRMQMTKPPGATVTVNERGEPRV